MEAARSLSVPKPAIAIDVAQSPVDRHEKKSPGKTDPSPSLKGQPIRLEFFVQNADLYGFRAAAAAAAEPGTGQTLP
jgi:hypothetical protein